MVSPGNNMLLMGKNYPPCTKMKERSMGFFGFGSQILPKANHGGENCHLHTLWRRSLQETQGATQHRAHECHAPRLSQRKCRRPCLRELRPPRVVCQRGLPRARPILGRVPRCTFPIRPRVMRVTSPNSPPGKAARIKPRKVRACVRAARSNPTLQRRTQQAKARGHTGLEILNR